MKVFVVGNSRSGTTMMGRMLGRHSQIHTFDELHFVEGLVDPRDLLGDNQLSNDECIRLLDILFTRSRDGLFSDLRDFGGESRLVMELSRSRKASDLFAAFLHYEAERNGRAIPCEQTPRYLFCIRELSLAYPDAIFINMVRDPRDVLLSQKNKWRRRKMGAERRNSPRAELLRSWANYHPFVTTYIWRSAIKEGILAAGYSNILTIKFEDLLDEPIGSLRAVCARLGLEFEENMLAIPRVGSSTVPDRPRSVGIDCTRAEAWRDGGLSLAEVDCCEVFAAQEMKEMGYLPNAVKPSFWRLVPLAFTLVPKMGLSFLLNVGRSRSMVEFIRRRMNGMRAVPR